MNRLVRCETGKRFEYYRCAHHRKGLPRPCLAVGKDAGIVALEGTFYYVRTKIIEDLNKEKNDQRFYFITLKYSKA